MCFKCNYIEGEKNNALSFLFVFVLFLTNCYRNK